MPNYITEAKRQLSDKIWNQNGKQANHQRFNNYCVTCVSSRMKKLASKSNKKHSMSGSKFYKVWENIKQRCLNPKHKSYKYYGGRGITICDEWLDFVSFHKDMYKSYLRHQRKNGESQTTIDRKNVHDNYYKKNCRWATHRQQTMNKQASPTKTKSPYPGVYRSCQKWQARIKKKGISIYIGTFDTAKEAHEAYLLKLTQLNTK